jgi:hypothetical protein
VDNKTYPAATKKHPLKSDLRELMAEPEQLPMAFRALKLFPFASQLACGQV